MSKPFCCGFVIFNPSKTETILVATPKNNLSFPKGKRKKGETDKECALRELCEETGINEDQIDTCYDRWHDEMSRKGILSIRYFVGILKDPVNKFSYDSEELSCVKWYKIKDIKNLNNLLDSRKEVFEKAYQSIK